jgi:hypothetical protein
MLMYVPAVMDAAGGIQRLFKDLDLEDSLETQT